MIWEINEFILILLAIAAYAVAIEIGVRLGVRLSSSHDEERKLHIDSLQNALLVLLALLLAGTFSMSVSRYENRKQLVLDEANAIGTVSLRAGLLPNSQRDEIRVLLREYVKTRLEFYNAGVDQARIEAAETASSKIQRPLWDLAVAISAIDPHSISTGLFISTLNDMFDIEEKRLAAFENRVPEVVMHILFSVSVVSIGFIAFGMGLKAKKYYLSTMVFSVVISLVTLAIIDLDRPRRGLIKVGQDSLIRVQQKLESMARDSSSP